MEHEGAPGLAQPLLLKLSVLTGTHPHQLLPGLSTVGMESSFFLPSGQQLFVHLRGDSSWFWGQFMQPVTWCGTGMDGPPAREAVQQGWGGLPGSAQLSLDCGFVPPPASLTK